MGAVRVFFPMKTKNSDIEGDNYTKHAQSLKCILINKRTLISGQLNDKIFENIPYFSFT